MPHDPTVPKPSAPSSGEQRAAAPSQRKTIDRLPSMLTVDEAARFFRIDRKTLYEAIRLDQVPGIVRFGKNRKPIRLSRDAVKRWIEGQRGE